MAAVQQLPGDPPPSALHILRPDGDPARRRRTRRDGGRLISDHRVYSGGVELI